MPVIATAELKPGDNPPQVQQIYNGLDAAVTLEVLEELLTIAPNDRTIYNFERALQGPALEMMLRGFAVDETERQTNIRYLKENIFRLEDQLGEFARAVWDKGLNPRSHQQLKDFFYQAMKLPEVWTSKKGVRKLSMDREALEKLQLYFHATPIVGTILNIRDLSKQLSILESDVDADGRMRTSYNIAGTETFRWSSSRSAEGTGTNLQNLPVDPKDPSKSHRRSIRKMFVADPGMELCGIDLEQAESREVGWLCGVIFGEWGYLDACESSDLHVAVAKLIWPELPWTGDAKADRAIAENSFYRDMDYRDLSKRGGHGSNYFGTPYTMARHLKVVTKIMETFQKAYFTAFPGIPMWHQWVAAQLQTEQRLINPFGFTRYFFGRPNDDTTLREAIAFSPQSSTAIRLNLGLWRIWYACHTEWAQKAYITAQVHDAAYFQYPIGMRDVVVPRALELLRTPLYHDGVPKALRSPAETLAKTAAPRVFDVPGEAKIGYNWGNWHEKYNPDGLKKWRPGTVDNRVRTNGLSRIL